MDSCEKLALHLGEFRMKVAGSKNWVLTWDSQSLFIARVDRREKEDLKRRLLDVVQLFREDYLDYSKKIKLVEDGL
jgi:hypothetical protein